jgi:hypothetical protein
MRLLSFPPFSTDEVNQTANAIANFVADKTCAWEFEHDIIQLFNRILKLSAKVNIVSINPLDQPSRSGA